MADVQPGPAPVPVHWRRAVKSQSPGVQSPAVPSGGLGEPFQHLLMFAGGSGRSVCLWLPCHCWLRRCLRLPHSHLVLPRLFLPWLVLPRFILRLPSHVQWPSTRGMSVTATSAPQPPSSTRSASGPAPFLDYGALDPRVDPQNCFGLSVLSHG